MFVEEYHCTYGIEVECADEVSVLPRCFPASLLSLFLDGFPFCELISLDDSFLSDRQATLDIYIYKLWHRFDLMIV